MNSDTTQAYRDDRPSWEKYFIDMAKMASTRSTCLRRFVGCVLTFDNRILSTGYNGSPTGIAHCRETGCLRQKLNVPSGERHEICTGLHGEMNALIQCALHGVSTKDSILYSTTFPCSVCAKLLINAKVKKIVYVEYYNDELSKKLLDEAGIEVVKYGV